MVIMYRRLLAMKAIVTKTGDVSFFVDLTRTSKVGDDNVVDVFFVKRAFEPLSAGNISTSVDVFTLHGAPLEALYHTLHGVWCPVLLQSSADFSLPPRVQQLLTELEDTLQQSGRSSARGIGYETSDIQSTAGITGPADELNFWRSVGDDRRSPYKTLAKDIQLHIQDLVAFSELENL